MKNLRAESLPVYRYESARKNLLMCNAFVWLWIKTLYPWPHPKVTRTALVGMVTESPFLDGGLTQGHLESIAMSILASFLTRNPSKHEASALTKPQRDAHLTIYWVVARMIMGDEIHDAGIHPGG